MNVPRRLLDHKLLDGICAQRRPELRAHSRLFKIFSGTDLECTSMNGQFPAVPAAYRQSTYTLISASENLQFVRNLLDAYSRKETLDRRAYVSFSDSIVL